MENDSILTPPPPPPPTSAPPPPPAVPPSAFPPGKAAYHADGYPAPMPKQPHVMRNILLGVGAFVVLMLVLGAIGAFSLIKGMKNSQATQLAVRTAEQNPQVTAITGSPLTVGAFVSGSINTDTMGGKAVLGIPVSGPQGRGTLSVNEERYRGAWRIWRLTFQAADVSTPPVSVVDSAPEDPANL